MAAVKEYKVSIDYQDIAFKLLSYLKIKNSVEILVLNVASKDKNKLCLSISSVEYGEIVLINKFSWNSRIKLCNFP